MGDQRVNVAGPLLGAAIIGCGVGYLIYKKTGNMLWGIGGAAAITLGDLVLVLWTDRYRRKKASERQK